MILRILAQAEWMNPRRARAYAIIFAVIATLVTAAWLALSRGGIDPAGKPLGTDFTSFWAASKLALAGNPAFAYDTAIHGAAERAIFDGRDRGYSAFFYPPLFLLLCLPLALLPYLASLAVWIVATAGLCWHSLERIIPGRGWLMLGYPASFLSIGHGQNAFLTTALFGSGVMLMALRPVVAGICLGALAFKPHLGLLVPVMLVIAGRWRVFAAAAATVTALSLLSWAVLGTASWQGFLAGAPLARAALEDNLVGYEKMASLFAGLRLLGAGLPMSWIAQGVLAFVMAVLMWRARRWAADAQGAALVAATCLATPFLLDYDLMLLAVPMAWLLARGLAGSFLPYEKTTLMLAFILPMLARPIAAATGLPLATPVLVALLACVLRRGASDAGETNSLAFSARRG